MAATPLEGDNAIDRNALASEHLERAFRFARRWCVLTDREWWRDEAEAAAIDGLITALDRWKGVGAFPTLLCACVRFACRHHFRQWCRARFAETGAFGSEITIEGTAVDERASHEDELERAESLHAVLGRWQTIETRDANRKRDEVRAFRLVYGLPDRARGGRSSYAPPLSTRQAARKLGRSPAWVDRVTQRIADEIRAPWADQHQERTHEST